MVRSNSVVGKLAMAWATVFLCMFSTVRAEILEVSVLPPNPTVGTEVTLHVGGYLSDLCWELSGHALSRSNDVFTIEINATDNWVPSLYCLQAIVPYSVDYELGILPAGTYAVRVIERDVSLRDPGTMERQATFAVGGSTYECDCACYSDFGCNGAMEATDVVRVIDLAFRGAISQQWQQCPWSEMDVDCSGITDIVDVIDVIDVAFRGIPSSSFCSPCSP